MVVVLDMVLGRSICRMGWPSPAAVMRKRAVGIALVKRMEMSAMRWMLTARVTKMRARGGVAMRRKDVMRDAR